MANRLLRRATYNDLLRVPDDRLAQIVEGELITSPRPSLEHSHAASVLSIEIGGPYHLGRGGPGGWWILFEPELHLGDNVLVPDLAGWRRQHLPVMPSGPYITVTPAWVCEVLSPSTASVDRVRKLRLYAQAGVEHAWIIDPMVKTLEVFERIGQRWTLACAFAGNERVHAPPFEAVTVHMEAMWLLDTQELTPVPPVNAD